MKSRELVAVSTFRSMADAQMAKGVLDEVGIESTTRADNAGGMYPAISGAELLVRSEDVNRANRRFIDAIAAPQVLRAELTDAVIAALAQLVDDAA